MGPIPSRSPRKAFVWLRLLFGALAEEGLEVSFRKTTWIASSPAVEAALKQQSQGDPVQVSSVAKDLGVANAAGRARRTHFQSKRLRKGAARGVKLRALQVHKTGAQGASLQNGGASLPPFGGTKGWASARSSCGPPALTRPRQAEGSNLAVLMLFSAWGKVAAATRYAP